MNDRSAKRLAVRVMLHKQASRPPRNLVQKAVKALADLVDGLPLEDRRRMKHWQEIGEHRDRRQKRVDEAVWHWGEDFFLGGAESEEDGSMSEDQFELQMDFHEAVNDEILRQGLIGRKVKVGSRTARLMKRQEKILIKYLDGSPIPIPTTYDKLPGVIQNALKRVKNQETLRMDVDRWLIDQHFERRRFAIRNVMGRRINAAKVKNKRVYVALRGNTLILDFRGDTGMTHQDPKQLQDKFRDFFIDVVNTEKALALPSTSKGHSRVEVFGGTLGFLVSRVYKWDGIAEYYSEIFDTEDPDGNIEPYSTRDLVDAVEDALEQEGWKVTR